MLTRNHFEELLLLVGQHEGHPIRDTVNDLSYWNHVLFSSLLDSLGERLELSVGLFP